MGVVFLLLGLLAWGVVFVVFTVSTSPIHEVFAAVIGVAGAVLIGAAGIITAVEKVENLLKPPEQRKPEPKADPPLV